MIPTLRRSLCTLCLLAFAPVLLIAQQGNQNDPFLPCLLAMTYEKMGQAERATEYYRKAYGLATSHNPPAAFVRPFARKKLGL